MNPSTSVLSDRENLLTIALHASELSNYISYMELYCRLGPVVSLSIALKIGGANVFIFYTT